MDTKHPMLYVIKPTYFMCTYVLQAIKEHENIRLIDYEKRKTTGWEKVIRLVRAYWGLGHGRSNHHILSDKLLTSIASIAPQDDVLFFGVENLKDLRIMEHEIIANNKSVFLWNTVCSRYKGWLQKLDFQTFVKRTTMQVCTFDPQDAALYDMRLLKQVYRFPDSESTTDEESEAVNSVFFVGKDKQRSDVLARMIKLLCKAGATPDFHILKDKDTRERQELKAYYSYQMLPYEDTLRHIRQSFCLLEVVQQGQQGLTLRSMEALFFNKKLITNNLEVKNTDFYRSENILIFDDNTTSTDIICFLTIKPVHIPLDIIRSYDICYWIRQFHAEHQAKEYSTDRSNHDLKCSLIVSVYKNTAFLQAVLSSLTYQTEQNFEVIVSEDGESDEMRHFLKDWNFNQPWQHLSQPDEGWQKNRALNRAIRAARTDHLIFIDGDCVLHPRFIEMHVRHFQPDAILAGKRVMLSQRLSERIINDPLKIRSLQTAMWSALLCHRGTKRTEEGVFISPDGPLGFIPRKRKLEYLTGCNMSFSRQAIERINGFDEDYQSPAYGEDTDLVWRFQMAGFHFVSLRNMAVQYHLRHSVSWTDQSQNQAIGEKKRQRGEYICKNGIKKL